jgi:nucleotide-binding universal stress UspA family protein
MSFPIKSIVAAIDLQDDLCRSVLKSAAFLSRKLEARLFVVDVWPRLKDVGFPYARMAEVAELEQDADRREARKIALGKVVHDIVPDAIPDILVGDVSDTIMRYLADTHADLLVIGSHQKSFWQRLMTGSTSEILIHDAPCAVLLVTPDFAEKLD